MPLEPIERRSLTDEVFDRIVGDIVAGDLEPGAPLPSERRLAEVLGVSRPAVREALKRLSQSGLIAIRHGDTTTVQDYRRTAGLDLLPWLLIAPDGVDLRVARSILEVRASLGPTVARLAASRAQPHHVEALHAVVDRLADADDAVARQRAALDLWETIVDASDNIALRLLFNALRATYEPIVDAMAAVMDVEVREVDDYRAVVAAIEDRRPAAAGAATNRLLERGTRSVLAAIDALLEEDEA